MNLLLSLCSRLRRIDTSLLALERDELLQEDAAEERVRQDRTGQDGTVGQLEDQASDL